MMIRLFTEEQTVCPSAMRLAEEYATDEGPESQVEMRLAEGCAPSKTIGCQMRLAEECAGVLYRAAVQRSALATRV